jgi:arylsulfatase
MTHSLENLFILVHILMMAFVCLSCTEKSNRLPNVIIIFTDDQGYGDVGCFGAEGFQTPNLDQLAEDGLQLTNFYSASSICTPSRAALLTGCYPPRVGITKVAFPEGPEWTRKLSNFGLHDDEITIAELLKPLGYMTACIGKWHLGHRKPFLPSRHGFDHYFGIPYSNDMRPEDNPEYPDLPIMENEDVIELNPDQSQLTKRYTEKAIEFIVTNRDKPFFLYLPHSMPHIPIFASERFNGISKSGVYGDVISEIDWSVGEIVKKIDELGLASNTLIIFTTDNGPWLEYGNHGGSAGVLKEGKFTTFEGGHRVPCIMKWQDRIPARSKSDGIITTMDLLPTIAALTGAKLPGNKIDGVDVSGHLINPAILPGPRSTFYYYSDHELQAVRHKQWKLHLPHSYMSVKSVGYDGEGGEMIRKNIGLELFNLNQDMGESTNLAKQYPDVVIQLKKMADEFDDLMKSQKRAAGYFNID